MSVQVSGLQAFEAHYGTPVTGAPKTIPQTNNSAIFNVSGGPIKVTSLIGMVTTAIGATAVTLSVGAFPTGGANNSTALCTAGTITSLAVGSLVALPVVVTNALIVGGASGVLVAPGVPLLSGGIAYVGPGTITVTTLASTTGAIQWTLSYVPVASGAFVTAA